MSKSNRCRRIEGITDKLTDEVIKLYDKGKMNEFWNGIESLQVLLEVKMITCGEHIE